MTKAVIMQELEEAIYVCETIENTFLENKLKGILEELNNLWETEAYYSKEIEKVINS